MRKIMSSSYYGNILIAICDIQFFIKCIDFHSKIQENTNNVVILNR